MNKKVILLLIIAFSSIFLFGCQKDELNSADEKAKFGTFEEEMKKKQDGYVENIDKYFSNVDDIVLNLDNYMNGKYSGTGEISGSFSVEGMGEFGASTKYNTKFIIEPKNLAFDGDINFSTFIKFADKFSSEFLKKIDNENAEKISGMGIDAKLDTKLGFADKNIYFSMDNLDVEISNPNNIQEIELLKMINFDYFNKKLGNKFLKYDLSEELGEEFFEELYNLLEENRQQLSDSKQEISSYISGYKNILGQAVSGDIFTSDGKLTEYEGKNAYKFSIDQEKLEKHIKSLIKTYYENNKEILKLDENDLSVIFDELGKKDLFKNTKIESEGYLVNNGGNVDLILKVTLISEKSDEKINIEIFPDKVNFQFEYDFGTMNLEILPNKTNIKFDISEGDDKGLFEMNFNKEEDGNVKYNGNMKFRSDIDYDGKVDNNSIDFSGNFKMKREGNALDSAFSFDTTITSDSNLYVNEVGSDTIKFNFSISNKIKKDDSLKITEKSILGNAKALTVEEYGKIIDEIAGTLAPNNYDDYEYDYDYYDEYEDIFIDHL